MFAFISPLTNRRMFAFETIAQNATTSVSLHSDGSRSQFIQMRLLLSLLGSTKEVKQQNDVETVVLLC
jgi:hypothetical protein